MARGKKPNARKTQTSAKSGARGRKAGAKRTAKKNVQLHTLNKDQLSDHIKAQTAQIKMLKSTGERRPLPKSQGFSAWSLRCA